MTVSRKLILYIVYSVVVVALAVGIIVTFNHHNHKRPVVKAPSGSQTVQPGRRTTPNSGSPADSSPSSTAPQATAGASTRTALNGSANSPLADTGPGSSLVIFLVATGLGAWGYRRLQLNRLR